MVSSVDKVPVKYYPSKAAAVEEAEMIQADPRVAWTSVQFEPFNGYVIRITPMPMDVSDYYGQAEVYANGKRYSPPPVKRGAPSGRAKAKPPRKPKPPASPPVAPPRRPGT